MPNKADRYRAVVKENGRLRAALGAIHDALHRNDANVAHELCEQALGGDAVTQPNVTGDAVSKTNALIAVFNREAAARKLIACAVVFLPSTTDKLRVSVQLGGDTRACKMLEDMLGSSKSTYMGEHQ